MSRTQLTASCLLALSGLATACDPGDVNPDATPLAGCEDCSSPVVETNQGSCYDASAAVVDCAGTGMDGAYVGNLPSYVDNGDGTVSDQVTGLTWQQAMPDKMQYAEAAPYCESLELGGHDDWRLPTIKEQYSLMDFTGVTEQLAYLDTSVFDFDWGDSANGERAIDAQWVTATLYVSTVMSGESCDFGVNHADGRIKCYPTRDQPQPAWRVRCVRGEGYGTNDFEDLGDGSVLDRATGLTWMQQDSGGLGAGELGDGTMDWLDALDFCESLDLAGQDDWRLPDVKELQSLVDYSRSPDTTGSAAIDPVFEATGITNEAGQADFAFYWSSTTHLDGQLPGTDAAYVSFGRAIGQLQGTTLDVHGAGAQRGDPKTGERSDYPLLGMGPQGDARRVFNLVRCVR